MPLLGGICGANFYVIFVEIHHSEDVTAKYHVQDTADEDMGEQAQFNSIQDQALERLVVQVFLFSFGFF